jgi:hypothetical protein
MRPNDELLARARRGDPAAIEALARRAFRLALRTAGGFVLLAEPRRGPHEVIALDASGAVVGRQLVDDSQHNGRASSGDSTARRRRACRPSASPARSVRTHRRRAQTAELRGRDPDYAITRAGSC